MTVRPGVAAVVAAGALLAGACSSGAPAPAPELDRAAPPAASPSSTTAPPTGTAAAPATTTTAAEGSVGAAGPGGSAGGPMAEARAAAPQAADNPVDLAEQLVRVETAIRDPSTPAGELAAAAHLQQVAYRRLGRHPEWDAAVLARVPGALHAAVTANAAARREFASMHTRPVGTVPAWRIVEPPPADDLLRWYAEAEQAYGVPWFYLAAVNLVETGLGRIRGTSVAGAQGPMQFMPATWAAFGEGDVNDPRDAIMAAARYLAHNGAPHDMGSALWNYNHAWPYVRGVSHYAAVMRDDTRAFTAGYYHWEVYLSTTAGDVLLPVGYEEDEPVPVDEWLRRG